MDVNITPEVASTHKNLVKLCEEFETSVDELSGSLSHVRPHQFYECECIPHAAACADALSKFPDVYSFQDEAYEKEVAASEKEYQRKIEELQENKRGIANVYANKVEEAEKIFFQHQQRLKETALQSIKVVQSKVEDLTELAQKVEVKLSNFTKREPTSLLENKTVESQSKISFRKALSEAKRYEKFSVASSVWMFLIGGLISLLVLALFYPIPDIEGFFPVFSEAIPPTAASIIAGVVAIAFIVFAILNFTRKKARVAKALRELIPSAEGECVVIQNEMQDEIDKASEVREKKITEADSNRVDNEIHDTDIAAKAYKAHEKRVEDASSKRDQAIAYIQREYEAFDHRLCISLEKFQSFFDVWSSEHAGVTAVLEKNSVPSTNENKRIASHFTRIGTVGLWSVSNVVSEIRLSATKTVGPAATMETDATMKSEERMAKQEEDLSLIDIYRRDAEKGDPEAQLELAWSFLYGFGVDENITEGMKWLKKAAEQGKVEAQCELAMAYIDGQGVQQNYDEAIKWYLKAAEREYPDAMFNLGKLYYEGEGVGQNYVEAMKWLKKAAELGHADSQFNLGLMYENGLGMRKDLTQAVKWYQRAADQEMVYAQHNLGIMYIHGKGVQEDYVKAAKWIQKAADKDFADAIFLLGVMHENGEGVKKNNMKAMNLYRRAAKQGSEEAIETLREIEGGA